MWRRGDTRGVNLRIHGRVHVVVVRRGRQVVVVVDGRAYGCGAGGRVQLHVGVRAVGATVRVRVIYKRFQKDMTIVKALLC